MADNEQEIDIKTKMAEQRQLIQSRYGEISKGKMANWFNLSAMFGTLKDIALSGVLSSRLDYRQLEVAARNDGSPDDGRSPGKPFFDYTETPPTEDGSFWFDYTSDVGDGFNPTYHVATQLAKPELTVAWTRSNGEDVQLTQKKVLIRGSLLVLGGDEVYPSATRHFYEEKFIKPYEAASYQCEPREPSEQPHMFALPGNHDWYDGLGAFMRVFAERKAIGLWRTRQDRSYFALKLPQNWWVLGLDVGLFEELDVQQVCYFQELVEKHMVDGDRIILCVPEPAWAKRQELTKDSRDVLFYFDRKVQEAAGKKDIRIAARIAGDLHHYRDHTSLETTSANPSAPPRLVHNITAGGGGAFLHPTHDGAEKGSAVCAPLARTRNFACDPACCFPSIKESKKLTKKNAEFAFRNRGLWIQLTLLYSAVFYLWFVSLVGADAWRQKSLLLITLSTLLCIALIRLARAGENSIPIDQLNSADPSAAKSPPPDAKAESRADNVSSAKPKAKAGVDDHRKSTLSARQRGALHALAQLAPLVLGLGGFYSWLPSWLLGTVLAPVLLLVVSPATLTATLTTIKDGCSFNDVSKWVEPPPFADGPLLHAMGDFCTYLLYNSGHLLLLLLRIGLFGGFTAFLSMFVFGGYLWLSLNRNGYHCNDAFASLRLEGFKNFLRIQITQEELIIYPIGFREVPKSWSFVLDTSENCPVTDEPLFQPTPTPVAAGSGYNPMLIDGPIVIRRDQNPAP